MKSIITKLSLILFTLPCFAAQSIQKLQGSPIATKKVNIHRRVLTFLSSDYKRRATAEQEKKTISARSQSAPLIKPAVPAMCTTIEVQKYKAVTAQPFFRRLAYQASLNVRNFCLNKRYKIGNFDPKKIFLINQHMDDCFTAAQHLEALVVLDGHPRLHLKKPNISIDSKAVHDYLYKCRPYGFAYGNLVNSLHHEKLFC